MRHVWCYRLLAGEELNHYKLHRAELNLPPCKTEILSTKRPCKEIILSFYYVIFLPNRGVNHRNRPSQHKQTTNQNSLFRSRDWLSTNQRPVFPTTTHSPHFGTPLSVLARLTLTTVVCVFRSGQGELLSSD
eukprot:sb/3474938/